MKNPKKIGIVGGADPAASNLLYQKIIEACLSRNDCNNGSDFPEIIIINFPFTRGMSSQDAQQKNDTLRAELQGCIDKLVLCGADLIAIACNTLHLFIPAINLHGKPLVHIITTTLEYIGKTAAKRLLLLATETTIHQRLYHHKQLEILTPTPQQQVVIDTIIKHIHGGTFSASNSATLNSIIQVNPCDSVILGCTDLPVLHHRYTIQHTAGEIFDSVDILAKELVNQAFPGTNVRF